MKERSLLNIKPDAVARNIIGDILSRVEDAGFTIIALSKVRLEIEEAEEFYRDHKGKPFFQGLCEYICSGPCVPVVVESENGIAGLRKLVGATDPSDAGQGTIRNLFGVDGRRNSVHASDSAENAKREISFFFSDHNLYLLSR